MFREINDGDRTGYFDKGGRRVGTISVKGHAQVIGECKFIEIDDNGKVVSLRKELPSTKPKATKATSTKTKNTTKTEKKDK